MAKRELSRFLRPRRLSMAIAALLGAATIGSNVALLGISALLLSEASLRPPLLDLMVLIVAVRFFGIARAGLRYGERYLTHDITFRILKDLRVWYYRQVEALTVSALERNGVGRLFQQIMAAVDRMKFYYLRVVNVDWVAAVVLVGTCLFLAGFGAGFPALVAALFILGGYLVPYLSRHLLKNRYDFYEREREEREFSLIDYVDGLSESLVNREEQRLRQRVGEKNRSLGKERRLLGTADSFSAALTGFFANLAIWGGLLLLIPPVARGEIDGVYLTTGLLVAWASFEAVQPLAMAREYRDRTEAAALPFFATARGPKENPLLTRRPHLEPGYEVENLRFSYGGDREILRNLSFSLPPGTKTALVGPTGAGKSSLAKLLLGWYAPDGGSIRLGGAPLEQIPKSQLREMVGVLDQDPYLFSGTIRENLRLAKPDADTGELAAALKIAGLEPWIASLPEGIDTDLGGGGRMLSGGQRQRLALCRIVLRDPAIIFLDEPTQSLDAMTAREILAAFASWGREKTWLFISHDHTGLERMDQILVLEKGEIVERGQESELLAAKGYYHRVLNGKFRLQGERKEGSNVTFDCDLHP